MISRNRANLGRKCASHAKSQLLVAGFPKTLTRSFESPCDRVIWFHSTDFRRNEMRQALRVKLSVAPQHLLRVSASHRLSDIFQRAKNHRKSPRSSTRFLSGFQIHSLRRKGFDGQCLPMHTTKTDQQNPNGRTKSNR